jgi:hypothetical protein
MDIKEPAVPHVNPDTLDLFLLEDTVWLAVAPTRVPSYDFNPHPFFRCRRPWALPPAVTAVGRFGVVDDYPEFCALLEERGIRLINSPEEHWRASELPGWYPHISDLTPRSLWFTAPPSSDEIGARLGWPVFIKGSRQTSQHRADRAIARSPEDYARIVDHYQQDPILRWQPIVCRAFAALRPVPAPPTDRIPPSFEFRTFWWRGSCVGAGPYWTASGGYDWTPTEAQEALARAAEAARRVAVPFLVVDVAQTTSGQWVVIECNDGQESGYGGVSPFALWQQVVACEASASTTG